MLAQQLGDARQPAAGRLAGAIPQVLIKPRRLNPRAVAAGMGQAAMRPRHPGRGQFALGQPLEAGIVLAGRRQVAQGRDVPSAADDGNAFESLLARRAQLDPHRRFASLLLFFRWRLGVGLGPQRRHQFPNRLEQLVAVLTLLDQMLPPALAVAVTGRFGDPAQRIAAQIGQRGSAVLRIVLGRLVTVFFREGDRWGFGSGGLVHRLDRLRRRFRFAFQRQADRLWQIHEAHRDVVLQAVADRLPFRGEFGEGIVDGATRFGGIVQQQRHRRFHVGVGGQRQHALGVGRTFDQNQIRSQLRQRLQHAARRTRPMMADAENRGVVHGRPRYETSRQAR